jgi:hypothetical protein
MRQTPELQCYPYNQWILDYKADGKKKEFKSFLKNWMRLIYNKLIDTEINRSGRTCRILPLFNILRNYNYDAGRYIFEIHGIRNYSTDTNQIFDNVLNGIMQERTFVPILINTVYSQYFPVRNGILRYEGDKIILQENNYNILIKGCSNVIYSETCDPEMFEKAKGLFEDIYPEEDERNYISYIIASCFCGLIQKDMFIELYGSGSDGKTTLCNLIMAMLGSPSVGAKTHSEVNGKQDVLLNTIGLASTMQASAILLAKHSGHDEGGVINIHDKVFCTIQEPDTRISGGKLNCARMKEITSGGSVSARSIYSKSVTFVPNCVFMLQTNSIMEYSEDSDAVRRRVCVIPHRTKFHTEINRERLKNLKHNKPANPLINDLVSNNPAFWQATFFYLKPYLIELLRSRKPISNIKIPKAIMDCTNDSFNLASGLIGYINNVIKPEEGKVINLYQLVEQTLNENKHNSDGVPILTKQHRNAQVKEVIDAIQVKYQGCLYRILKQYCFDYPSVNPHSKVPVEQINAAPEIDAWKQYFEQTATTNVTSSNMNSVFIVGHILVTRN